MGRISRRTLLHTGGAAAAGAVVGGAGVAAYMSADKGPAATPAPRQITVDSWRRDRKVPYYIGHRGAGDVAPEHSLPSYQRAFEWGADALEISVVRSADNVIYCMHDTTLDRTTTLDGRAAALPASGLDTARVTVPRLGSRWVGSGMPPLPKLSDVLATFGHQTVLCLEAKDDSAYPEMVRLVEEAGLKDTVMIKLPGSAVARMDVAKQTGYPIYAYLGNPEVATAAGIDRLGKLLDPGRDALVLPARSGWDPFPADLYRRAVDTGIPVWAVPVHRRQEVSYLTHLGVEGIVSPDVGYLNGAERPLTVDRWTSGAISPGELTRDPFSDTYALHWDTEGVIGMDVKDQLAFVSMGQFCPIEAPSYRIDFDAAFDPLPIDTWQHLSIAFGHEDDRYYAHRSGAADGYHAQLRADGSMELFAHVEGDPNGRSLSPTQPSIPCRAGVWAHLTLEVTPDRIRWSRDNGSTVLARDSRFRGGYFHLGRSGNDGKLKIRNLTIS